MNWYRNWSRNWYWVVFSKGAQFDGRSRRKEFWMFELFNILIILAQFVVAFTAFGTTEHPALSKQLYSFHLRFISWRSSFRSLAVTVRRLHDTGKSGWMILPV